MLQSLLLVDPFWLEWTSWILVLAVVSFLATLWYKSQQPPFPPVPIYKNGNGTNNLAQNAVKFVAEGFEKYPKAFILETDAEPTLILSPEYAQEIKNDPRLDHARILYSDYFGHLPGFNVFDYHLKHAEKGYELIRVKLTKDLAKYTSDLNEEAALTLRDFWTDNPKWHEIVMRTSMAHIVARVSGRVFLGKDLCRNPEWLRIPVEYVINLAFGAAALRKFPKFLRPLVHWFIPQVKALRQQMAAAYRIIQQELEQREFVNRKLGTDGANYQDAIQWTTEIYKGLNPDHTLIQLGLAFGALHTSTDFLTQVIYDLCRHPELIRHLREEIISVVSAEGGLNRNAIRKFKLMDSVLKESQRLKPASTLMMRRVATSDIVLKDGLFIPKGTSLGIPTLWHFDEAYYDNPEKFDGYRFLRMAEEDPSKANQVHLVSTGPNHLGFGHGKLACPGRFFAAEMAKLVLAHILLKYDFKLVDPNENLSPISIKWYYRARPGVKILVRRRAEEVSLYGASMSSSFVVV